MKTTYSISLVAGLVVTSLATAAIAQDSKTELARGALTWDASKEVAIFDYVRSAGWVSPPHYHTGQVFLIIVDGDGAMVLGEKTFGGGPGTIMEAQPGEVMVMKNSSTSEPLTFKLIQIGPVGEPMIVLAK